MTARTADLIDGKAFAQRLRERIRARTRALADRTGAVPGLAAVLVGDDPASAVYVRNKGLQAKEAGFLSVEHRLDAAAPQEEVLRLVAALNADPAVHGILVQLPLPAQIDPQAVIAAIDPEKDVDGFHVVNRGRLVSGGRGFVPCTPLGCLLLLRDRHPDMAGLRAVVLGRSNIVGRPMAELLVQADCTVTVAHSRTRDLADECRRADVLVAAVGRPEFVRGDWIRPGATVIDVGINRMTGPDGKARLVGDVAFEEAAAVAGAITPVPGGVGPMTIACLLSNTLLSACRREGIEPEALDG